MPDVCRDSIVFEHVISLVSSDLRRSPRLLISGRVILATALVVIWTLAAACGGRAEEPAPAASAAPVSVSTARVSGTDEPVTIEATGSFKPDESSDVAPEVSGRVVSTPVEVGAFVKRGQTLIRIQGVGAGLKLDESRATVARAEANLKLAESQNNLAQTTAQRYAALLATGDVSKTVADQARTSAETAVQSVNTARASLAEAHAQLAQAEKAVSDVVVPAPFAGYISARSVSVGEYVQPSTPVVTLLKIDPLRLELSIPAIQAGQVAVGQRVTARVDSYPDQTFDGILTAINPAISAESRTFIVEVRVPNADGVLKPGMFAVATIDQGRSQRALLVPRQAVVEDPNTNSFRVFVIDDQNRARLRVVQLAARQQGETVRILTGVQEGERVATSNLADLYDGAQVAVSA